MGHSVDFAPFLENATTPGILGRYAGLCDREEKVIRMRTTEASRGQIAAVIEYELEHAAGEDRGTDRPEFGFRCGGMLGSGA